MLKASVKHGINTVVTRSAMAYSHSILRLLNGPFYAGGIHESIASQDVRELMEEARLTQIKQERIEKECASSIFTEEMAKKTAAGFLEAEPLTNNKALSSEYAAASRSLTCCLRE